LLFDNLAGFSLSNLKHQQENQKAFFLNKPKSKDACKTKVSQIKNA
jgi:hypothetical protein